MYVLLSAFLKYFLGITHVTLDMYFSSEIKKGYYLVLLLLLPTS